MENHKQSVYTGDDKTLYNLIKWFIKNRYWFEYEHHNKQRHKLTFANTIDLSKLPKLANNIGWTIN